jgi:uncharacterized protein YajQ (UPF0234 family)
MPDKESRDQNPESPEPSRQEEALQVVRKYIDDLQAFIEELRAHLSRTPPT